MTRTMPWLGWLVATSMLLAGCQQQSLRDDAGSGATGNLGSPLVGPSPADVYIELSGAYLRQDRLTEAFMNAKKAVIVDPRSSNAHYVLALVNQRAATAVSILDGILEGDDVFAASAIEVLDQRNHRGALSGSGGSGNQHQAVGKLDEPSQRRRQAQRLESVGAVQIGVTAEPSGRAAIAQQSRMGHRGGNA